MCDLQNDSGVEGYLKHCIMESMVRLNGSNSEQFGIIPSLFTPDVAVIWSSFISLPSLEISRRF